MAVEQRQLVNSGGADAIEAAGAEPQRDAYPNGRGAVTPRAVIIGLVCALFLCAVTPYNDFKVAATYIAGTQFPIGALFVLFFLATAVNVGLRRFAPRFVFRPGELVTVWTLIAVASGLPSVRA